MACSPPQRLARLFSSGRGIALSNCWEFSAEILLATFCFIFNTEQKLVPEQNAPAARHLGSPSCLFDLVDAFPRESGTPQTLFPRRVAFVGLKSWYFVQNRTSLSLFPGDQSLRLFRCVLPFGGKV